MKLAKWCHLVFRCIPRIVFEYFRWILPYSRHPERYPIELRYARARKLVLRIVKACRFAPHLEGHIVAEGPRLYVCNHVSAIDPLLLIALSEKPVSFIVKVEARRIPVVGRLIRAIDGLFLDRNDPFQAVKLFRIATKNMLDENLSYAIYPEGTRNKTPYTGKPYPLHPGSFKIAKMAKCPITAFAIFGSFHFYDATRGRNFPLYLKALYHMDYEGVAKTDTTALARLTEKWFADALVDFAREDRRYFAEGRNRAKAPKWWDNPR